MLYYIDVEASWRSLNKKKGVKFPKSVYQHPSEEILENEGSN